MEQAIFWHLEQPSLKSDLDKVVQLVSEVAQADKIYLLGIRSALAQQSGIFHPSINNTYSIIHCYLLVLIHNPQKRPLHEWQDKIEQHCEQHVPVTTIVLESVTFNEWFKEGHVFAFKIFSSGHLYTMHEPSHLIPLSTNHLTLRH